MSTLTNIADSYNPLAVARGYEVRLQVVQDGIRFVTLNGSEIWTMTKLSITDSIDFACDVEQELVRIGERSLERNRNHDRTIIEACSECGLIEGCHTSDCPNDAPDAESVGISVGPWNVGLDQTPVTFARKTMVGTVKAACNLCGAVAPKEQITARGFCNRCEKKIDAVQTEAVRVHHEVEAVNA